MGSRIVSIRITVLKKVNRPFNLLQKFLAEMNKAKTWGTDNRIRWATTRKRAKVGSLTADAKCTYSTVLYHEWLSSRGITSLYLSYPDEEHATLWSFVKNGSPMSPFTMQVPWASVPGSPLLSQGTPQTRTKMEPMMPKSRTHWTIPDGPDHSGGFFLKHQVLGSYIKFLFVSGAPSFGVHLGTGLYG